MFHVEQKKFERFQYQKNEMFHVEQINKSGMCIDSNVPRGTKVFK